MDKNEFLNPKAPYHGQSFSPGHLVFNSNLQEFSNQVSYIVSLETNRKIRPIEAYKKIKDLWEQLEKSKESLLG